MSVTVSSPMPDIGSTALPATRVSAEDVIPAGASPHVFSLCEKALEKGGGQD